MIEPDSNLENAKLKKIDLSNENLRKASLNRADLSEANLNDSNLEEANLSKANLKNVILIDANVENTDFQSALNLTLEQVKSAKNWEKQNTIEIFVLHSIYQ